MPRPRKQPYPLPMEETRNLADVEKIILQELSEGDKRTKILRERTKVSGPTLHKHLNRLEKERKIEKSQGTGAWRILEPGLRALQVSRVVDVKKLNFVDGCQHGEPTPFLVVAGLAENTKNSDLHALVKYRSELALERWVREILALAKAKKVLPKQYFDGRKHWDEITSNQWSRIQREVLSGVGDVGYAEDVTPKDFIAQLAKAESKSLLRKMSERNQVVPDFRSYLANVSEIMRSRK